jgi:uncharacterized repeat protein (TIGR01451 family)
MTRCTNGPQGRAGSAQVQPASRLIASLALLARRPLRIGLLVGLLALGLAQTAWADAPDIKIPPEKPLPTAIGKVDPATGHVTVELIGAWSWPTHGSNCNENRAGSGVAVDWFDPKDEGNALGASVTIEGKSTPIAVGGVGNSLNAADNVVHPTENDEGTGSVVDIAKPSEYKNWRGGCGVYTKDKFFKSSEAAKKGELTEGLVAHGNFGHVAPGALDLNENPFENPTPPASSSLQGAVLKHVYNSKSEVTHICAVEYDVHGTEGRKKAKTGGLEGPGVGTPSGEKEVTAGANNHNSDNGVQGNSSTPTGNACTSIKVKIETTQIETQAKGPYTFNSKNGNDLTDVATLKGGTASSTGKIKFTLFEEAEVGGKKVACGKEVGKSEVAVTKGALGEKYESGAVHVSKAGTYYWFAKYSGDELNAPSSQKECPEASETTKVLNPTISIEKSPASQSVEKGGTVTFTITVKNTSSVDLENVKVEDPESTNCDKTIGTLKAGGKESYECTKEVQKSFTNVAEACGESQGVTVCEKSEAKVNVLDLAITKTPAEQFVTKGATATFTITVKNTGETDLENVAVTDLKTPACNKTIGTLKAGAKVEYTCKTGELENPFVNTAQVCGEHESVKVCREASAEVKVRTPSITVEKTPGSQSVTKGGSVKFKITVTNNGEVDLENTTVEDKETPGCAAVIGLLKKGASETYECEAPEVNAPFKNIAKACGESEGVKVCEEGEAHVGIEELASTQDFKPADNATITVSGEGATQPNGKITFKLYKGKCEAANLIYTSSEEPVNANGEASTLSAKLLSELIGSKETAGTYNWQISYGSDTNGNKSFTGTCGTEHFTVTNS